MSPLPYSEVKATAKSIAKYCWKSDFLAEQEFIKRQTEKGRLGGLKGKGGRPKTTSVSKPWEALGISRSSWYRQRSNNSTS